MKKLLVDLMEGKNVPQNLKRFNIINSIFLGSASGFESFAWKRISFFLCLDPYQTKGLDPNQITEKNKRDGTGSVTK